MTILKTYRGYALVPLKEVSEEMARSQVFSSEAEASEENILERIVTDTFYRKGPRLQGWINDSGTGREVCLVRLADTLEHNPQWGEVAP